MTKIITGDPATDRAIEHTNAMFNHFFQPTEADDMSSSKIKEVPKVEPIAQIDIAILTNGKCITETTLDVFAEWDDGDKTTGAASGWVINTIMLGKNDVTNEMDLTEIQEYLREIL